MNDVPFAKMLGKFDWSSGATEVIFCSRKAWYWSLNACVKLLPPNSIQESQSTPAAGSVLGVSDVFIAKEDGKGDQFYIKKTCLKYRKPSISLKEVDDKGYGHCRAHVP